MPRDTYMILLAGWAVIGLAAGVGLFFVAAPYGRHARRGWGPTVDSTWGWVWMEATSVVAMLMIFGLSGRRDPLSWLFVAMWELHYVHRAFVFPWRRSRKGRATPLTIVGLGVVFNLVNCLFNGYFLFYLAPAAGLAEWLARPVTLIGIALFVAGLALNIDSDNRLLRLRRERGYAVPHGGGFRWVSCPNYLGEITEWIGWALATASPAAGVFAWWTLANLAPRARSNHRWYLEKFADYPRERRILLPHLW